MSQSVLKFTDNLKLEILNGEIDVRFQVYAYALIESWKITQNRKKSFNQNSLSPENILNYAPISESLKLLPTEIRADFINWFKNISASKLEELSRVIKHFNKSRINFFNQIGEILVSEKLIKDNGIIFTPDWLVIELVDKTFEIWKEKNPNTTFPKLVGDLSCGAGAFLIHLTKILPNETQIIGVDINPELAFLSSLVGLSNPNFKIKNYDTLLDLREQGDLFTQLDIPSKGYDILISNPPYVRSQALLKTYSNKLKKVFPEFTKGNFDLVVLFIAHALETLRQGGIGAFVLSNKFMSSKYGTNICNKLVQNANILEITNFGDGQLFPNRTTYTSTIIFEKTGKPAKNTFTVKNFPSGLNWRNGNINHKNLAQIDKIPIERLRSHPWDLSSNAHSKILECMQNHNNRSLLDVFAYICQSIRTGANQVFIVEKNVADNFESEILFKHLSGENIKQFTVIPSSRYLIWPYKINTYGNIEVIPIDIFEKEFPNIFAYLTKFKKELSERKLDPNQLWYSYSRVQNLELQYRPKVLVKEMMPRAEFATDLYGGYAITSGYALVARKGMDEKELKFWNALLCTPTMEFQLRQVGTQLHSGWFRLMKHHLKRIKLPAFSKQELQQGINISEEIYTNNFQPESFIKLDKFVATSFGLKKEMRDEIEKFIKQLHSVSKPQAESKNSKASTQSVNRNTVYLDLNDDLRQKYIPIELSKFNKFHVERNDLRQLVTFVPNKDQPIHNWYSFTQGYSSKLVEELLKELKVEKGAIVLDPFAGCGTTLLACKKNGISSIGVEISPFLSWVAELKIKPWDTDILYEALNSLKNVTPKPNKSNHLLFNDYFSKAFDFNILAQVVGWRDWFKNSNFTHEIRDFFLLGLVGILEQLSHIRKHGSHYRYLNNDQNVGLSKLNIDLLPSDTDIKPILVNKIQSMIQNIEEVRFPNSRIKSKIILGDARKLNSEIKNIDAVITSPPYLNRNNYTAQQKAELSLLGLIDDYQQYRELVYSTFKSHVEHKFSRFPKTTIPEVSKILESIELSDNNNAKIPHMIAGYFEDIKETLQILKNKVKSNGKIAFVVGNSRWGGVVVPVDHLVALLAEQSGLSVEKILVTRMKGNSPQQMRKYGRIAVRESIVILKCDNKN